MFCTTGSCSPSKINRSISDSIGIIIVVDWCFHNGVIHVVDCRYGCGIVALKHFQHFVWQARQYRGKRKMYALQFHKENIGCNNFSTLQSIISITIKIQSCNGWYFDFQNFKTPQMIFKSGFSEQLQWLASQHR